MGERVHIYVDSVHSIGGVTTWAFQVSAHLTKFDARVVTVTRSRSCAPDEHLFPGPRISLYSGLESLTHLRESIVTDEEASPPTIPTKPTIPTIPTKPTSPTKHDLQIRRSDGKKTQIRQAKVTKETKPTKPTLPTKPTILGHALVNSWDDLSEFVRVQISKTDVFVPNYLEVGYRHAAISRLKGFRSRCIGICHTDLDHYHRLVGQYERIIHTFLAVSGRCRRKLCDLIPHREKDIYYLPYGVDSVGPRYVHRRDEPNRLIYSGRLVNDQKTDYGFE
jgi:hypothetical protein